MSNQTTLLVPAGQGMSLNVLGAAAVYKARSSDTGGRFTVFEQDMPPGYGVPSHRHADEDECFFILEGEVVVEDDAGAHRATVGDFVLFPRGTVHGFRNETTLPARALVICTPGRKLQECFTEFDRAARKAPLEPAQIGAIAAGHGIEIKAP